jgi:hypothetical protein
MLILSVVYCEKIEECPEEQIFRTTDLVKYLGFKMLECNVTSLSKKKWQMFPGNHITKKVITLQTQLW